MKILLLGLLGFTSSIAVLTLMDSPRYKYMADLQSSIADEQGIPIQSELAAFPTSVSCLRDLGKKLAAVKFLQLATIHLVSGILVPSPSFF